MFLIVPGLVSVCKKPRTRGSALVIGMNTPGYRRKRRGSTPQCLLGVSSRHEQFRPIAGTVRFDSSTRTGSLGYQCCPVMVHHRVRSPPRCRLSTMRPTAGISPTAGAGNTTSRGFVSAVVGSRNHSKVWGKRPASYGRYAHGCATGLESRWYLRIWGSTPLPSAEESYAGKPCRPLLAGWSGNGWGASPQLSANLPLRR